MTEKINGYESHHDIEGAYEVQADRSKKQSEASAQQTGMRWPSVAALFILCATVVVLCWITTSAQLWD